MTAASAAQDWSPRQQVARVALLAVLSPVFGRLSFLPLAQHGGGEVRMPFSRALLPGSKS